MSVPSVRVREVRFRVLNMRTRMPFRYGIASLLALPHLFVEVEAEVNGRRGRGWTAEGLPPKWFTKDPATRFEADLEEMLRVIRRAAESATSLGAAGSPFEWWEALHERQEAWAAGAGLAPLLAGLGTSLLERAMLDAVCRSVGRSFPVALREGVLGIHPGRIHAELPGAPVARWLPEVPVERVRVRHTVGLSDPLEESDIPGDERIDDGLPQSLTAAIRRYGLSCFKVKLCGDAERDLERLGRMDRVLRREGVEGARWTLDGNEQFPDLGAFRRFWERFIADPGLGEWRRGLMVVEQPLPRAKALDPALAGELRAWEDRPPLIIDESDGEPGALRRALELGYSGGSHKNCKGVFRGVANACLLAYRRERQPGGRWVLTSEDLATVGPVAMLQDLCVAASLGLDHSERNGHHYFRGLGMFPSGVQSAVARAHPDLYETRGDGLVSLRIDGGILRTGSVMGAPFGCGLELDLGFCTPLEAWSADSLGLVPG